jgi:hypothetical protein
MTTTTYDWVAIVDGLNQYLRLTRRRLTGRCSLETRPRWVGNSLLNRTRQPLARGASGTLSLDVESSRLT